MDQRYLNTIFITQLPRLNYVNLEKISGALYENSIFTHNFIPLK